jgi:branched-chain amino acid transport system substrate-binding protein
VHHDQAEREGGVHGARAQPEEEEEHVVVDRRRLALDARRIGGPPPILGRPGDAPRGIIGGVRTRLVALGVVLAVAAAACSSGKGHAGPHRATGKPLVVGMINMEDAPAGSFPEIRQDAQAAVRYVNEELGGVGNRPIQLVTCKTDGTPESSQACATELQAKRPVAVLGGIDLGASASMPVFEKANIPYVGLTPALGDESSSTTSFMLAGGLAADLLAEADYITGTLHATKVGVVHLDLPGLQEAAVLAAKTILEKQGVADVKIVSEKADAADFVPAVKAATASNPDVLVVVFPAQGCTRILQAVQALRLRSRLFLPSACAASEVFDAAGAAANGVTFASALLPYTDTADPEVATYLDKRRRYGAGDDSPSVLAQAGFALVMDLHRELAALPATPTPAALTERLKAVHDEPSFMAHPYTCDGQQITVLPSICNAWVRLLVSTGQGHFDDLAGDWVSGAHLVKILTG